MKFNSKKKLLLVENLKAEKSYWNWACSTKKKLKKLQITQTITIYGTFILVGEQVI